MEDRVVVVNIGHLKRAELAAMLRTIRRSEPAAIGLDARLYESKGAYQDSTLAAAIARTPNLVLGSYLAHYRSAQRAFDTLQLPLARLQAPNVSYGFLNLVSDAQGFRTIRDFAPTAVAAGDTQRAFAVQLAAQYDSAAVQRLLARNNPREKIDYIGNIYMNRNLSTADSFMLQNRAPVRFMYLDTSQVLAQERLPFLKDKIVVMGFVDPTGSHLEDAFFTPLNPRYAGKTYPDMYGVVIHANIISMILRGDYIDQSPPWLEIGLAVLAVYLNAVVFTYIYQYHSRWFDLLLRSSQVIESLLVVFLVIIIFHYFQYDINITYVLLGILLGGDILEIYLGFSGRVPWRRWLGLKRKNTNA
jgi:CHASE2 domain-containing sensor protein